MGKGWFLRILIFALLWIVGSWFFQDFGGSVGTNGSMLYIGESIIGSNLNTGDANSIITLIVTFIITAAAYFFVSMILTFIIMKIFRRN